MCCDNLYIDKNSGSHIYRNMKSVFSNISIILIALLFAGLLENTPAKAMMQDNMHVEFTNCQVCEEVGTMNKLDAACASVCIVSAIADKTASESIKIRYAEKTQFERRVSHLKERSEFPEPHPPKHTS